MTPAEAAREVAESARTNAFIADTRDNELRWDAIATAFAAFADALDRAEATAPDYPPVTAEELARWRKLFPVTHANPCPDGLACPLADDFPEAHGIGATEHTLCCPDFPCCPCD